MIAIVQRVTEASVTVEGECVGACGKGFMVLLGVAQGDDETDARLLADKIAGLRIFTDADDKMNLSLADVNGEVLAVPNFTLLANYRRGNRPDYLQAEKPPRSEELFCFFVSRLRERVPHVSTGVFGEHMKVSLVNDGPITIPMDSKVLRGPKNPASGQG